MSLHVNRSLSLKTIPVIARRPRALEPVADPRAALAAQLIPAGARVLDLSDGTRLQRLLPEACSYRACSAFDFDTGGFPADAAAQSDIVVMLGTLERIDDLESFFTHLRFARQDVILSYGARGLGDGGGGSPAGRPDFVDFTALFERYGFRAECTAPLDNGEVLMRLTPSERVKPVAPCSVAIIAGGDPHDFGNRLGLSMIQALLPGEAEIDHLTPETFSQARAQYDLVVLGTGNGLLRPLFDERVLELVGRAKAAVGLFGTQHRELIPRAAFERLLDRLDTWFARHQDDVLIYGRGRANVVHLGDWIIDRFPLATPANDEPLRVTGPLPPEVALDRAIATFQRHRQVYSEQLHPLLCALTSAEAAAYAERPAATVPGTRPGQFRSMLVDIFGRSYPEGAFFPVDRAAVSRYKAHVHRQVGLVRDRIEAILRNVAVAAG